MAAKGGAGEGPPAVAAPGNCFCCTLFCFPCMCCNRGKYRAHNGIEGSAINDWLSTCLLFAPLMPLFTTLSTHQLLNDYEIKNNGKFGFFGKFTPGTAAVAPGGGSPASAEMTV